MIKVTAVYRWREGATFNHDYYHSEHMHIARAALAAAGLLISVDCVKELPATLLLRPLNLDTLSTIVYGHASRGVFEDGALAALLIVCAGLPAAFLLARTGQDRAG